MDDRDLYDQAADRHPTVFLVDREALARAEELFGPEPDQLEGWWEDRIFRTAIPRELR